jgi:hypothetical protein
MVARYISPQQMKMWIEARSGTPILPRDIITAMLSNTLIAITLPNGRTLYPMPARIAVSEALDALSQTDGDILVRRDGIWIGEPKPGGGGGGSWTLLDEWSFAADGAFNMRVVDLQGSSDVRIVVEAVTLSASGWRAYSLSEDGGATWLTGTPWRTLAVDGQIDQADGIGYLHSTSSSAARHASYHLFGLQDGWPTFIGQRTGNSQQGYINTPNPLTHLRMQASTGVPNWTAGSYHVWGR